MTFNEPVLLLQEQLAELNLGPLRSQVASLAVVLALEAKSSQRELTSRLLAQLVPSVLSSSDLENSLDQLLRDLPDLVLDTPGAPQVSRPLHQRTRFGAGATRYQSRN